MKCRLVVGLVGGVSCCIGIGDGWDRGGKDNSHVVQLLHIQNSLQIYLVELHFYNKFVGFIFLSSLPSFSITYCQPCSN